MVTNSRARRYPVIASETKEGQERQTEYYLALGKFVAMFSRAEIAVQLTLRFYARLSANRAHIIFHGTRTNAGGDLAKSLAAELPVSGEILEDLTHALAQLQAINTTRNDVLHYGVQSIAEGEAFVKTAIEGVDTARKVRHFAIPVSDLEAMTSDLRKIILHLRMRHMGRPPPKSRLILDGIGAALVSTWLYRPQQPQRSGSQGSPQTPSTEPSRSNRRQRKSSPA
jgi:hypothetical protein